MTHIILQRAARIIHLELKSIMMRQDMTMEEKYEQSMAQTLRMLADELRNPVEGITDESTGATVAAVLELVAGPKHIAIYRDSKLGNWDVIGD